MKKFFKLGLMVLILVPILLIWLLVQTVMVLSTPIWIWGVLESNPVKLLPLIKRFPLFKWCYRGIILKRGLREEQPQETKALVIEELLDRNPRGLPTSAQVAYLSWLPSDKDRIVAMGKLNRGERKNVVRHIVKAGGFALLKGVYDKGDYSHVCCFTQDLFNDIIDAIQNQPPTEVVNWIRIEVLVKRRFITNEVKHILKNKACWDIFSDDEKKVLIAILMPTELTKAIEGVFEEYGLLSSNDGLQILASYAERHSLPIEIIVKLLEMGKASDNLRYVVDRCFTRDVANRLIGHYNRCRDREKKA